MVKSNTDEVPVGTGFGCPTIGNSIPKGYKLVCGADNRWRLVKTKLVVNGNVSRNNNK